MAYCPASDEQSLQLVFEHVSLGSLHQWLHKQERPPSLKSAADILIQVGEAVQFLHSLGWLHASLSSHAVQLVNPTMAKLAQLEHLTREEGEQLQTCPARTPDQGGG